jgi:hypothetical protein
MQLKSHVKVTETEQRMSICKLRLYGAFRYDVHDVLICRVNFSCRGRLKKSMQKC